MLSGQELRKLLEKIARKVALTRVRLDEAKPGPTATGDVSRR